MKYKYKNLIPFALIFFMALAWYQIIRDNEKVNTQYTQYVEDARSFAKDGVLVDAQDNYLSAIQLKDSIELRQELAELYYNNEMIDEALDYAETIISVYPDNAKAYEYAIGIYMDQELYGKCFSLYDKAAKLGVVSSALSERISEISYKYKVVVSGISDVSVFANDICAVKYGEYWGFMDASGQLLIGADFIKAGDFTGDKAFVQTEEGEQYFVDAGGEKRGVLPEGIACEEAGNVVDGVYVLSSGGQYDYYNMNKEKLFGGFSSATTFCGGFAAVLGANGYGLIDRKGNQIGNDTYTDIARDERNVATENDRAFFRQGDSWVMVSMEGTVVGSDTYEEARPFYASGYAAVKKGGQWGFIDAEGGFRINPQYEDARSFMFGHAAVKKDGKWGFIDDTGKMVIEPVFDEVRDMNSKGNIFVMENGGWELISLYRYNY